MTKNTALLVIDIQNALVDARPYHFDDVFVHIGQLIQAFQEKDMEIIYVQHTEPEGEFALDTVSWELYKALPVRSKDKVLVKHYNSAFKETDLDRFLSDKGVDTLVIVGMQTEFCIDSTAKAAFEQGYSVFLPPWTNTTLDSPFLTAEQIYRHYNDFVWKYTIANTDTVEQVIAKL